MDIATFKLLFKFQIDSYIQSEASEHALEVAQVSQKMGEPQYLVLREIIRKALNGLPFNCNRLTQITAAVRCDGG